jgi:hypothetical protein
MKTRKPKPAGPGSCVSNLDNLGRILGGQSGDRRVECTRLSPVLPQQEMRRKRLRRIQECEDFGQ